MSEARKKARLAKDASIELGLAPASVRSRAIELAADKIEARASQICAANARDLERGRAAGMPARDRRTLRIIGAWRAVGADWFVACAVVTARIRHFLTL